MSQLGFPKTLSHFVSYQHGAADQDPYPQITIMLNYPQGRNGMLPTLMII